MSEYLIITKFRAKKTKNFLMSRNTQNINRKLQLQKTQIRSILSDFRKAKYKCIALSTQINTQMPKKIQFEAIEKQIQLKLQLLDAPGLVSLKSRLMKCLSQLFDIENDLSTQKERRVARSQFNIKMKLDNNQNKVFQKEGENLKLQFKKNQSFTQNSEKNILGRLAQKTPKAQQSRPNTFSIPIYNIKEDTSQNKVDRLTKYVASLKSTQQKQLGNMKINAEDKCDQRIKDILHQIPQFLALKEELQLVKKQKLEIENQMKVVKKKCIEDFLSTAEVVQENQSYKLIKIYKNQTTWIEKKKSGIVERNENKITERKDIALKPHKQVQEIIIQPAAPRRLKISQLQQEIQLIKSKRKDAQIQQIERELSKQEYNVESVVSKINSTLESNEQKLKILREQRIKIFQKEQDIWSQLQQI